jgi:YD repeat-containing protein
MVCIDANEVAELIGRLGTHTYSYDGDGNLIEVNSGSLGIG